jgi:hypothetical protein
VAQDVQRQLGRRLKWRAGLGGIVDVVVGHGAEL